MHKLSSVLLCLFALMTLYPPSLQALDDIFLSDKLEIGPGISVRKSLYVDQERFTQAVPIVVAKYENFYAEGDKAALIFYDIELSEITFWTELIALYRQQGFTVPQGVLSDLNDRDDAVEMGVALAMASEYFGLLNLSLAYDVIQTHKGYEVALNYEIPLVFEDWIIRPVFSIRQMSYNLSNYYFGVTNSEATVGRDPYTIHNATNYVYGIDMKYLIDEDWRITSNIEWTKMDETITLSPVVEHSTNLQFSIALIYDFF